MSLKIGVFGIGAIGNAIAYELQKNVLNELYYFNRSSRTAIKLITEEDKIEIPISIHTIEDQMPILDWLIICIKEHQFEEASDKLSTLITSKTKVVVIRNGLNLKEPLLSFTDESKIVECSIDCPTQPVQNGFYQQLRKPILTLQQSGIANEFESLFDKENIKINQEKDFKTESWKKLCESASLGAILCLSGETCWVFEDRKVKELYINVMKEAIAVARVDGAKIEDDFIAQMTTKLNAYPATKGSSMLTDRSNGNVIEIGAKNGIISRLGAMHNIATPLNDLITVILSKTNNKKG